MSTFEDVGLKKWLGQQCAGLGMKLPTPVQVDCIPQILKGQDCIGCAKTGSGKTAAFALPILHKLSDDPYGIFALVLTPTRELAFQIKEQFVALGAHMSARVSVVVGGMDMLTQGIELSRKPHVVIATPGRLADHINSGDGLDLGKVKFLVLDEADRLFEPCFESDLKEVFSSLPKTRQTLMFSATLSETIEQLRGSSSTPPHVYIAPADIATVESLKQEYLLVPELLRNAALAHLLQSLEDTCIIFTHSCKSAQILTIGLKKLGFPCTALHSQLSQHDRLSSLAKFKCEVVKILVATDVASRGLDIPTVSCVVNYNTPSSSTDYIHRVGRTARAGAGGRAVTIVTQYDVTRLQAIEASIGTKLEECKMSDEEGSKIMQPVALAMREALLHLDTHDFGQKKERNKRKTEQQVSKSDQKIRKVDRVKTAVQSHHNANNSTTSVLRDGSENNDTGSVKVKRDSSKAKISAKRINVNLKSINKFQTISKKAKNIKQSKTQFK